MINWRLYFAFFAITLATSFQFGYHTAVINAPLPLIQEFIANISSVRYGIAGKSYVDTMASLCVSAMLIGGMFGGFLGGFSVNKFGRKKSVFICSIPNFIGCICLACSKSANSFELIIFGRLLVGLACGAFTAVAPTYLSELAPISIRGAAGSLHQLVLNIAIVIAQVLGLRELMNTEESWPYLLALCVIPGILGLIFILFCPESARYLYLNKGDVTEARRALQAIRGENAYIIEELNELQRESERGSRKSSVTDLFKFPHLRMAIFIAIVAHIGQQFSGINSLLYYSVELFKSNGISESQATYVNFGMGLLLLIVTALAVFLVERAGRRVLLIGGLSVCFVSLIVITICLVIKEKSGINSFVIIAIVVCYIFVCGFAIGPGPIAWFLVSEMFAQENRDAAVTITVVVNWLCNITVGMTFLKLITALGIYTFLPFVVIMVAIIVLLYFFMPETKGRPSTEIENHFKERIFKRSYTDQSELLKIPSNATMTSQNT